MRKKRVDYSLKIGEKKKLQEIINFEGYNDRNRPLLKIKCNNCSHEYISSYPNFKDIRKSGESCQKCTNITNRTYKKAEPIDNQVNIIYSNYKSRAKFKGWEFDITKDEFKELIFQNCSYCNIEPSNYREDRVKNRRTIDMSHYTNGIDRIDSSQGYIKGNMITCCEDCNNAKRNLSHEQFLDLIKRIYEFRKL